MKKITAIILCAMSASILTSCGKPNLEGIWELCNSDGEELGSYVKFKDDGVLKIDDEKGKYEVIDEDTVKIKFDGEKYECDFEIIDEDESFIYLEKFSNDAERKTLNSFASTFYQSCNSAITYMDEYGMYYKNSAIICSDSSKNINPVPENADADFDFIDDEVRVFFSDVDNYDYIIYIEDGVCTYTALKNPSDDVVGTLPPNEFNDMTFDEIYEELKSRIE